jgi:hypothetical protein
VDADEAVAALGRHSVEGKSELFSHTNTSRGNTLSQSLSVLASCPINAYQSLSILGAFCPLQTGLTNRLRIIAPTPRSHRLIL